ncbi:MAG TPA: SpoIIE family protein phosphatase [Chitinophagaceae bacterium]|nr:SpoIIE family protein phosphatase [Chitinophagaceae bacterium]
MADASYTSYALPDRSYQAVIRSELRNRALAAGFIGHRLGEVEIIIAEITTNLIKHAGKDCHILARILKEGKGGLELIAMDSGPGIRRPLKMMQDGESTKNTLGQGLGAIQRLSNHFDLYSMPGWGTILYSRIHVDKKHNTAPEKFEISVLSIAKEKQVLNGDAWCMVNDGKKIRLVVIDGLGHGAAAHNAAQLAVTAFKQFPKKNPTEQLKSLHESLRKTRGAVATVVYVDVKNRQLMYSGVGNISMKVISAVNVHGCFSYNGIVGHIMPVSLNDHLLQWNNETDTIIMHSDGLTGRWDVKKYPGIMQHSLVMLCAALYKDHSRGNDDTTILIGRSIN